MYWSTSSPSSKAVLLLKTGRMSCQYHDSNSYNETLILNVLAHWTSPGPSFTIKLQVRLQVETLQTKQKTFFYTDIQLFVGRIWRAPTCMCLQSCPLAGSWIRLNVIGHLRDTLIAVCSTPSSPFRPGVPGMVPLLKFLFTLQEKQKNPSHFTKCIHPIPFPILLVAFNIK